MPSIKKTPQSFQRAIAVSLTTQMTQWTKLSNSTNNLANANTPGFKKQVFFTHKGPKREYDGRLTNHARLSVANRDFKNGSLQQTQNPLDIAINGKGFFQVRNDKGTFLSRNGQLTVNNQGNLVQAATGARILNNGGGEINLPQNLKNLVIQGNGTVIADGQIIDQIGVFNVNNLQALKAVSGNYFSYENQEPEPLQTGFQIQQFGYESSNTSAVSESIELIEIMRTHEHAQKIITQVDEMLKRISNISYKNI